MTNKIIAIIAVIVIAAGIWFVAKPGSGSAGQGQSLSANTSAQTSPTGTSGTTAKSYTMTDIAKHNSESSCWTTINGKVYDLTSFISQHRGGPDKLLSICGIDGSSAFNQQHGDQPEPNSQLKVLFIGILASK